MSFRFHLYFLCNYGKSMDLALKKNPTVWQLNQYGPFRQNRLSCLAVGFYAHQSRISCKIYLEPLNHALSPWVSLVERVCNFILNPISAQFPHPHPNYKIMQILHKILICLLKNNHSLYQGYGVMPGVLCSKVWPDYVVIEEAISELVLWPACKEPCYSMIYKPYLPWNGRLHLLMYSFQCWINSLFQANLGKEQQWRKPEQGMDIVNIWTP